MSSSIARRLIVLVYVLTATIFFVQSAHAAPPGSGWGLQFADEFNGTTLDSMKWINRYPWSNNSTRPQNVTVTDGVLNLIQKREPWNGTEFSGSAVSSRLTDSPERDMFNLTYGYVEASIKLPTLPGSWPAFWMLQGGWPPEVDIMEYPIQTVGTNYNQYSFNLHYTNSSGSEASLGAGLHDAGAGNLTTSFHTFGMEWTASTLKFYLDGRQQGSTITNTTAIAQLQSMYLLFTNGGGSWAGTPTLDQWPSGVSDKAQVDWVRVWQKTTTYPSSVAWTKAGSGTWDETTAWSGGSPQLNTQTATFGTVAATNVTIDWSFSRTIGGLIFNGTTNYTLGSGNDDSIMLANPNGTVVIDATGASGSGTNYINSRVELYNNLTLRSNPNKPLTFNGAIMGTGNLRLDSGQITLARACTYTGNTTIAGGTLKLSASGSITSNLIDVAAGTFDVSSVSGYSLGSGKTLRGNGSIIGAMTVLGTVQPGESPGILNTGNITFGNGSLLNVELAGATAGTLYDVLNSSGSVNLQNGSKLKVSLINSFAPQNGDVFDILNFSSLTGTFSTVDLPILTGGYSWDLNDLYNNGTISVVPEPATLTMLLTVLVAMCAWTATGRRRQ